MAIIGKIRKHSGLAVIIVGVAIAAFVIGDFGKRRAKNVTDIGEVNGEQITYKDFTAKVDEVTEIQKENSGSDKMTEDESYNIRQSTWNNMVRQLIMDDEYATLGLTVSSDELFDQVQGRNPHRYILQYFKDPNTGIYDPALVLNYLKNLDKMEPKNRTQWLQFEKAIKEDRQMTKFNNLITKAYYVPKAFLKKDYTNQTKSIKLRFVSPPFFNIPDSLAKPTDADFQAFYDKNKGYFYADAPTADLDYVLFDVQASPLDRQKIAEDVASLYKDFLTVSDVKTFASANSDFKWDTNFLNKGKLPEKIDSILFNAKVGTIIPPVELNNAWYMSKLLAIQDRPDSMNGLQMLVTWDGTNVSETVKRTKEQAKLRADSIVNVLKKDPTQFTILTTQLSDFPSAKKDKGELKWFTDDNVNFSLFFNAGLEMKPNDIKVIETGIGYAIFKMTDKTKPKKKIKAAVLQRNIEPSNQTFQDTYLRASAFAGENKTQAAFDTAAAKTGVPKRTAQGVKEMDNQVQGLANAREMVRWAFAEATKTGEVSPVFDLSGKYVVAIVKEKNPKGLLPLEKIKTRIEPQVKNLKKIEVLSGRIAEAAKKTPDLYALALQFSGKVDTTVLTFTGMNRSSIGREQDVVGELFSMTDPRGKLVGPLKGNFGTYIILVDEIVPATPKEDYTFELSQLQQMFSGREQNGLYDALLKASEIKDNRAKFY